MPAACIAVACVALLFVMSEKYREADNDPPQTNNGGLRPIEYVEDGVKTTVEHEWYPNSIGIAERVYTGAFDYDSIEAGHGTLIRLYRLDVLIDSLDGAGYFEIAFQLPEVIEAGKKYKFRSIPSDRKVERQEQECETTAMQTGEATAFRYGNPMMGWMTDDANHIAELTVLHIGEVEMRVHVRLAVELEPRLKFDVDENFTLQKMDEGA